MREPTSTPTSIIRIERLVGNGIRGTLGKWLFGALRYLPDGTENPEFILNRPSRIGRREILVAGANFGCGSSREGAVWALQELRHPRRHRAELRRHLLRQLLPERDAADHRRQGRGRRAGRGGRTDARAQGASRSISKRRRSTSPPASSIASRSTRVVASGLLEGLDEVALTLRRDAEIRAFQAADRIERPWVHFAGKRHEYALQHVEGRRRRR